jgi:DNA-directed RNA polymerase specialized sigma24 family protein
MGVEMALDGQGQDTNQAATERWLAGILAVLVEAREQRLDGDKDAMKIEVLLSRAGLSNEDIAAMTGKKADTIRVALHRAKGK